MKEEKEAGKKEREREREREEESERKRDEQRLSGKQNKNKKMFLKKIIDLPKDAFLFPLEYSLI